MEEQEQNALADKVTERVLTALTAEIPEAETHTVDNAGQGLFKNAGDAIGLVAGVVALAYVLGGVVITLRLMLDHYRAEQTAGLIGGLPREFVISLGFIEVLAPAAVVGTIAALGSAALGKPTATADEKSLKQPPELLPSLGALAVALSAVAVAWLSIRDGWRDELLYAAVPIPLTFAILCAGWRGLRLAGGRLKHTTTRALVTGLAFITIAVPTSTMGAVLLHFEHARVCVAGESEPLSGRLVALTADRAVLAQSGDGKKGGLDKTLVTVPGDSVTRSATGTHNGLETCPVAPVK